MKKSVTILFFFFFFIFYSCFVQKTGRQALYELQQMPHHADRTDSLFILDAGIPESGQAEAGYQYLLSGNLFSSGIPAGLHKILSHFKHSNIASLDGYNKYVLNDFTTFKNGSGRFTAAPGCLHCHAQQFNGQLVIGLGNSYSHFQENTKSYLQMASNLLKTFYGKNSNQWKTASTILTTGELLAPQIITEMQGPTSAHRIAELLASHRDPVSLRFRADTSYFIIPPAVIPTDVPALWLTKKKKAFTINAMEQGNFLKHLMSPALLTLKDTSEAREIFNNIKNLWAYLMTLSAPVYPYPINQSLAAEGKLIFEKNCSNCHGTYGQQEYYPNKLVAAAIIKTDSLMWKYYSLYPEYEEWFNKSWFATTLPAAYIKPQAGYVASPLNGIWITAPFFHNGSVPTLEGVLNSKIRPRYWKRNFKKEKYDYKSLGWKYKTLIKPGGKKTYNTDIPGYGNYGHYFGDYLSNKERKALIEYLKTL